MKFVGIQRTLKITSVAAAIFALTPAAWAQGIGELTLNELMTPTAQKLERGAKLWTQNCVSCHGTSGAGDGPNAMYFSGGVASLAAGTYRHGGGLLQVHNLIEQGLHGHPLFEHLPYQDLWALTHYTRSLATSSQQVDLARLDALDALAPDPPELLAKAKFDAREGVCNPLVKSGIDAKMKFLGDAQIKQGEAVFATNCATCHGTEGKGDGSGAAALKPPPRNFTSGDGWTKGTSALAIFDSLANGVEGTQMAAFKHLSESDRWAMTHLIREKWLPAAARAEATPEQVDAVCRSLSGGGSSATISVEDAMKFLAAGVEEDRTIRMVNYGPAWVDPSGSAVRGQQVYEKHCQSCHGPRGVGSTLGPYGSQPPYLVVKVNQLVPGLAGGTYKDFASRSIGGVHIAIPDVTGASHIAESDWNALHAYVTSFEGARDVRPISAMPAAVVPQEAVVPTDTVVPTDAEPAPASPKPAAAAAPAEQPEAPSVEQ